MGWFEVVETEDRIITTNDFESNKKFCNNKVVNSKYTVLSFLPLILFAHLKRFMNFYFIIIGTLQLWDAVSPVNPITTWAPIFVIFAIAFLREGFDDYIQHKQDRITNERLYTIIRDGVEQEILSQDIYPGDIIMLKRNQESPCDLSLIYTTNIDNTCCIETANLDGETNLKERTALSISQNLGSHRLKETKIIIRCSPPNPELYKFDSKMYIGSIESSSTPINTNQLIQQGVYLRNVDYIYGVVCYTGKQTKLGLNS